MAKKTSKKARPAAKSAAASGKTGFASAESLFNAFPQAPAGFGFDEAKEQLCKLGLLKGCEDAAQVGKENVEAAIKSGQILAKAAEEMGKAIYGFTQASVEMGVQASKAMMGVKTLKDLMDVQSEYAKNSLDHLISGTSKISDMAVKVANEAMEPISQRVNEAIEKIGKAA